MINRILFYFSNLVLGFLLGSFLEFRSNTLLVYDQHKFDHPGKRIVFNDSVLIKVFNNLEVDVSVLVEERKETLFFFLSFTPVNSPDLKISPAKFFSLDLVINKIIIRSSMKKTTHGLQILYENIKPFFSQVNTNKQDFNLLIGKLIYYFDNYLESINIYLETKNYRFSGEKTSPKQVIEISEKNKSELIKVLLKKVVLNRKTKTKFLFGALMGPIFGFIIWFFSVYFAIVLVPIFLFFSTDFFPHFLQIVASWFF